MSCRKQGVFLVRSNRDLAYPQRIARWSVLVHLDHRDRLPLGRLSKGLYVAGFYSLELGVSGQRWILQHVFRSGR